MRVVTIGGGTGQYAILQALLLLKKAVQYPVDITSIPATSDDGGSSGVMRLEQNIFAVGDIAQCAFGLHPEPHLVAPMLGAQRFVEGSLTGHTTRNVIVASYLKDPENEGRPQAAMDKMAAALHLEGRIAPITFDKTKLHARVKKGRKKVIAGEDAIGGTDLLERGGVERLWLSPSAKPNEAAIEAIRKADLIIVCPGTLVCSIVPNFLVDGVVKALKASRAVKLHVTNLMNRLGHEPQNWSVLHHVRFLERWLGKGFFDGVLYNTQALTPAQVSHYKKEKIAVPMRNHQGWGLNRKLFGEPLIMDGVAARQPGDAIAATRSSVRHDPERVAGALRGIIERHIVDKDVPWLLLALDRVVLDTDRLESDLGLELDANLAGEPFAEKELGRYIHMDVVPVLSWAQSQGLRVAVVAHQAGEKDFQRQKLEATALQAGIDEFVYVKKKESTGLAIAAKLGKEIRGVMVSSVAESAESIEAHLKRVRFMDMNRRYPKLGDARSLNDVRPVIEDMLSKLPV